MGCARRIRARREALHLTQRDVAERSGVKQPLISAIESGRREPSTATRAALDRVLTVRPSQVLQLLRQETIDVIERHRGATPQIFGSVARGTDSPESDIDFLIAFNAEASIIDLLSMDEELAELLTVPVDVVSAGSSGRVIDRAQREAVPL